MDSNETNQKDDRIRANRYDYSAYLIEHPATLKKIRGKEMLMCAICIMNYALWKQSLKKSSESVKKNNIYPESIMSYLEKFSDELIYQTIKRLVKIVQLQQSLGSKLSISSEVLSYFHRLTGNDTYESNEKNESSESIDTVNKEDNDQTDGQRSPQPLLSIFYFDKLHDFICESGFSESDIRSENKTEEILNLVFDLILKSNPLGEIKKFEADLVNYFYWFGIHKDYCLGKINKIRIHRQQKEWQKSRRIG